MKIIVEPTGALAACALLEKKLDARALAGRRVGVILSGGNVDLRWAAARLQARREQDARGRDQPAGGPEVLKLTERPVPQPQAHEVLVRVAAAGVKPPRRAAAKRQLPGCRPTLPTCRARVAGEVVAKGSAATLWKIGDRVCALVHGGGYADTARS